MYAMESLLDILDSLCGSLKKQSPQHPPPLYYSLQHPPPLHYLLSGTNDRIPLSEWNKKTWKIARAVRGFDPKFAHRPVRRLVSDKDTLPLSQWSKEQFEARFSPGREPNEPQIILDRTKLACEASFKRGILELYALKMTDAERESLVGDVCDDLCKELRKKQTLVKYELYVDGVKKDDAGREVWRDENPIYGLIRQGWYALADPGQAQIVDGLFQIIAGNPLAFLQMVA